MFKISIFQTSLIPAYKSYKNETSFKKERHLNILTI